MKLNFFLLQAQNSVADASKKINENAERFTNLDPIGIGMAVIGMAVVFAALLLLYLLFMNISKIILKRAEKKPSEKHAGIMKLKGQEKDMIVAAISLSLHQHLDEIHDNESMTLTINRVAKNYSPWGSKIYMLRQIPRY